MAMNKKIVSTIALSAATAAMLTLSGCGSSSSSGSTVPTSSCTSSNITEVLSGDITADKTLSASEVYGLDGKVRVMPGVTLTVAEGTTIAGCSPASYLLVKPSATIIANGSKAAPITFTSQTDLDGQSAAGEVGEWGGLILLGNAFVDHGVTQYEAGDAEDTFGSTAHTDDGESSGTLNYVAIKHTGFKVAADKELNGLSMGGVGSGTVVTNIAIIGGADDAMEIWGGTVDVTGLYATNAKDDSVDTDLGYRGNITNVYVKQNIVDNDNNHDSAAIETGNDSNDLVVTAADATLPTITNFTAEVKGAGIYMKNDAGLNLSNAKFISTKTIDTQLITYRTDDVVATDAMTFATTCLDNGIADTNVTAYLADANTKDAGTDTAYADLNASVNSGVITLNDQTCAGATITDIWKGHAGDNEALTVE